MLPRFLEHSNDRQLSGDYAGDVLLWDIDKTYLNTHFSSWRGLIGIPFEFAIDKETVAGAVPVLRALRRGLGPESAVVPLYFVSGSPPQLRRVIERKMTLDGVDFDGITFKDQLGLLLARRPRDIREQVGYKLSALLLYRCAVPAAARWLLFGDDVEADALVFVLFGTVVAGLRGGSLLSRLRELGVARPHAEAAVALAEQVPVAADPVERVFIHMSRSQEPPSYDDSRVAATRSYVQTAAMLCTMGRVGPETVAQVARELRLRGLKEAVLSFHLDDAEERLGVPPAVTAVARR